MAKPTLRGGGFVGSKDKFKKSLKKSSAGLISNIPEAGYTGFFLTDPDGFFEYYEHYDEQAKEFYPCMGRDAGCPGCAAGIRASHRWLAHFLDSVENKTLVLKLPVGIAEDLNKRWERRGTIMDRSWELSKEGSGLDTSYSILDGEVEKKNLKRWQKDLPDLEGILVSMLIARGEIEDDDDEDEDEEDEAPRARRAKPRAKPRAGAGRRRSSARNQEEEDEDDEDEDDDPPWDDEDDEEEEPPRRRKPVAKKSVRPVKKSAGVKRPVKKTLPRRR